MDHDTPVSVDDLTSEVMARVRRRLLGSRVDAGGGTDAPPSEEIDAALALMLQALERRHRPLLAPLAFDDEDWTLQTSLRLRSHRPRVGALLVGVKRRVLLPVLRWLYDYSRENFVRQKLVNASLMACVETLMVEVVRLRREVDALQSGDASAPRVRGKQ